MRKIFFIGLIFIAAVSLLVFSGCSSGKYGKTVYESRYNVDNSYKDETKMTLQKLGDDWENYNIYYSGFDTTKVGGILFDPKNDGKTIQTVNYKKALKKETLESLVHWNTGGSITGMVYQILGYDGQPFGYIYHPHKEASPIVRIIDENTIEVQAWKYFGEGDAEGDAEGDD